MRGDLERFYQVSIEGDFWCNHDGKLRTPICAVTVHLNMIRRVISRSNPGCQAINIQNRTVREAAAIFSPLSLTPFKNYTATQRNRTQKPPRASSSFSESPQRSRWVPDLARRSKPIVRFGGAHTLENKQPIIDWAGSDGGKATTGTIIRSEVELFEPTGTQDAIFGQKQWKDLGLSDSMISALTELQLSKPTAIQELAIPTLANQVVNAVVADQTGTGKTLAYLIPMMEHLKKDEAAAGPSGELHRPRGMILAPSRELAEQIGNIAKFLGRIVKLRVVVLVGGLKFKPEKEALQRQPVDLIVTTTGRLLKHREQGLSRL
jgi:hypothetical protein